MALLETQYSCPKHIKSLMDKFIKNQRELRRQKARDRIKDRRMNE